MDIKFKNGSYIKDTPYNSNVRGKRADLIKFIPLEIKWYQKIALWFYLTTYKTFRRRVK